MAAVARPSMTGEWTHRCNKRRDPRRKWDIKPIKRCPLGGLISIVSGPRGRLAAAAAETVCYWIEASGWKCFEHIPAPVFAMGFFSPDQLVLVCPKHVYRVSLTGERSIGIELSEGEYAKGAVDSNNKRVLVWQRGCNIGVYNQDLQLILQLSPRRILTDCFNSFLFPMGDCIGQAGYSDTTLSLALTSVSEGSSLTSRVGLSDRPKEFVSSGTTVFFRSEKGLLSFCNEEQLAAVPSSEVNNVSCVTANKQLLVLGKEGEVEVYNIGEGMSQTPLRKPAHRFTHPDLHKPQAISIDEAHTIYVLGWSGEIFSFSPKQ